MSHEKDLTQFALFLGYVVLFSVWFASASGSLLTLVMGINVGVGLTGAALALFKLYRPDKYRFKYEPEPGDEAGSGTFGGMI